MNPSAPSRQSLSQQPAPAPAADARGAGSDCSAQDTALDFASLNLLCNLESLMATFREKSLRDRIETATTTVNAMLLKLLDFADQHFDEQQMNTLQEQFRLTLERHADHERALTMRHWTSGLRSLVLPNAVDPTTIPTYVALGRSVLCTCGTAFTEMLNVIGEDSGVRSEICQSSIAFLGEMKSIWL